MFDSHILWDFFDNIDLAAFLAFFGNIVREGNAMSNLFIVIVTSYIGLCVGTYINVSNFNTKLNKFCIAILAPAPVLALLTWLSISLAFKKIKTIKDLYKCPLLLILCLSMYVDAMLILFCESKEM